MNSRSKLFLSLVIFISILVLWLALSFFGQPDNGTVAPVLAQGGVSVSVNGGACNNKLGQPHTVTVTNGSATQVACDIRFGGSPVFSSGWVAAGATTTAQFTPSQEGHYDISCDHDYGGGGFDISSDGDDDGDGVVDCRDTCRNCPGSPPNGCPICGDNACANCGTDNVNDCIDCAVCGDGICTPGENCPADCSGPTPTPTLTPTECWDCDLCGDGICAPYENHESCPQDCYCGNGTCDSDEDNASCPSECYCGNGTCDSNEDQTSCPGDCCIDGICDCVKAPFSFAACEIRTVHCPEQVNIRRDPSTNNRPIGVLQEDQTKFVECKREMGDGTWYRLIDDEGWVRSDVVENNGQCFNLDDCPVGIAIDCPDSELVEWVIHNVSPFVQASVVSNSPDPCGAFADLKEATNQSALSWFATNSAPSFSEDPYCAAYAFNFLGAVGRLSAEQQLSLYESDPGSVSLCPTERHSQDPDIPTESEVLTRLYECEISDARYEDIYDLIVDRAITRDDIDVNNPGSCTLLNNLNLLGGQLTQHQKDLYDALLACPDPTTYGVQAIINYITWAINNNVPEEEGDDLLAQFPDPGCAYPPDVIDDFNEPLPQDILETFPDCDVYWVTLFLNRLDQLSDTERAEVREAVTTHPLPCQAMIDYLNTDEVPDVILPTPTPSPDPNSTPSPTLNTPDTFIPMPTVTPTFTPVHPVSNPTPMTYEEMQLVSEEVYPGGASAAFVAQSTDDANAQEVIYYLKERDFYQLDQTTASNIMFPVLDETGTWIVYLEELDSGDIVIKIIEVPLDDEEAPNIEPQILIDPREFQGELDLVVVESRVAFVTAVVNDRPLKLLLVTMAERNNRENYGIYRFLFKSEDLPLPIREAKLWPYLEGATDPFAAFNGSVVVYNRGGEIHISPVEIDPDRKDLNWINEGQVLREQIGMTVDSCGNPAISSNSAYVYYACDLDDSEPILLFVPLSGGDINDHNNDNYVSDPENFEFNPVVTLNPNEEFSFVVASNISLQDASADSTVRYIRNFAPGPAEQSLGFDDTFIIYTGTLDRISGEITIYRAIWSDAFHVSQIFSRRISD